MYRYRRRLFDILFQNVVVVDGEEVSARVFVDGRVESSDENALLYASTEPVILGADYFKICFAKMVAVIPRMLHDGRLTLAGTTKCGGEVFIHSRAEGAGCFADVASGTRGTVCAGTGAGVDDARLFRRR